MSDVMLKMPPFMILQKLDDLHLERLIVGMNFT